MQQIIIGLQVGSWYALVALAIVLILKSTSVANFAVAQMGLLPVFVVWTIQSAGIIPYWLSVAVGLLTGVVIGCVVERVAIRPLLSKGHFATMIMTFSVLVIIDALIQLLWSPVARQIHSPFDGSLHVAGQLIQYEQLISIALGLFITIGLQLFFRSPFGVQMQAISEDRTTARLLGISASAVSRVSWAFAGAIATLAMLLQSQATLLTEHNGSSLLIRSFAAAALGGFGSVVGAFLGGIALGIAESLASAYISTASASIVALLAIVLVLSFRPSGVFGAVTVREV